MNSDDHVLLGDQAFQAGRLAAALSHYSAALGLDSANADAHFGRGMCSYQTGDNATAAAAFTDCLVRLAPDSPRTPAAYMMRCLARANLEDRKGAIEDYREAVSRDPSLVAFLDSVTCVGTAQVVVMATIYPAQTARILNELTKQ